MKENLFDLVSQVKDAKEEVSVSYNENSRWSELYIYPNITVQKGPVKFIFNYVRYNLSLDHLTKTIAILDSDDPEGAEMFINDLKVDEIAFRNNLKTLGLINYEKLFESNYLMWDNNETLQKALETDVIVSRYLLNGYKAKKFLTEQELENVKNNLVWSDLP